MSSDKPVPILRTGREPTAVMVEHAVATIRAALPPSLLCLLAWHLEAMHSERAHGSLEVGFHMHGGDVRSVKFGRMTSWQRSEPAKPPQP